MKTKEFLNENYKLRRELDNYNIFMAKQMINLLEIIKNSPESIDLDKIINGYKQILEDLT